MAERFKTTFKSLLAGRFDGETDYYNYMSEMGWQLTKAGCFRQKFRYDESVRYYYKFDYCKKPEDFDGYLEDFRAVGWEYVSSSANGWHVFRRVYGGASEKSETKAKAKKESDTESEEKPEKEFDGRLAARLAIIIAIPLIILIPLTVDIVNLFTFPRLLTWIGTALFVLCVTIEVLWACGAKVRRSVGAWACFVGFALLIAGGVMGSYRPRGFSKELHIKESIESEFSEKTKDFFLTIRYPDFYYFDLDIDADSPVTVSIVSDEDGRVAYSIRGDYEEETAPVWLTPGEYTVYITDFAGGKFSVVCNIR